MPLLDRFSAVARALENRNYRLYTTGNALSLTGTWMQRLAVGWLTWQLTRSGTWLGIIAVADLFPTVLVAPLAGAVADRFDRLRLVRLTQALSLLQAAALALLVASGTITIELLLGLTLALGTFSAFNQPARLSLISSLVRPDDLAAAIAINSIVFNLARFIGPALAGAAIVWFGLASAFATNAVTFLVFLVALALIRLPAEGSPRSERRGLIREAGEGYAYAMRHQGIGPVLALLLVATLCARPFIELLPGLAAAVFNQGADGLAWLTSMTGLGALLAGLFLAQRSGLGGLTAVAFGALLLAALSLFAFTATTLFAVALPAAFVFGCALTLNGVATQTLVQRAVAPAMRGRVLGLYGLIVRGGPAAGALLMGALSERLGLRLPLAGGALICAFAWFLLARRRREIASHIEPG